MPANLTPEYEKAERRYREATTDEDRLEALREMLRVIPKHKGTDRMQGDIKRRISQLRKAAAKRPAKRGPDVFHVPRGGAGQVVLIGPPNTGKSSIVAATSKAPVKVAEYPFSTPLPVPGMAEYEDVQVQIVDTPPVTAEHMPPGLMGTIRLADIVAVVVDCSADALGQAEATLSLLVGRGVSLLSVPLNELPEDDSGVKCGLVIANKADACGSEDIEALRELYAGTIEVLSVSSATGEGITEMLDRSWRMLAMVRVYSKERGRPADMNQPFTLRIGSTIEDLARDIHRELPDKMKYARIWGEGRFDGQQVHRTEILKDRDIVEIHE